MGRLITVSNNDSGSNAKAKISFDIKNVKKTADTEEGSLAKRPVFSIKSSQTDQAGTAEENPETPGNQTPVSQRPVFDIHTDAEQKNGGDSVSVSSDSLMNAEAAPQITVQSKVPESSVDGDFGSQAISLTSDDLKTASQGFSLATSRDPESLETEESQSSEIRYGKLP